MYTEYSSQNYFVRTYQEKLAAVVMLRAERMITIKEEQFDIGALSVGLLERVLAVSQGHDRYERNNSEMSIQCTQKKQPDGA